MYTPAEKALAALWWDYATEPTFDTWLDRWMPPHIQYLRDALEVAHLRIGQPTDHPERIARGGVDHPRLRRANDVFALGDREVVREIMEVLPTAYKADAPWRGFSYSTLGYRDWHVTSHRVRVGQLLDVARTLKAQGVLDWFYGVEAHGQHDHMHALMSFRHGHPQGWVRETFRLPEDPAALLAPIHGSFERAREYLDNQATTTAELGSMPDRRIYVDGNKVEIPYFKALDAIAQGDPTTVLLRPPTGDLTPALRKALNMWMSKSQAQPRVELRLMASSRDAWDTAWQHAKTYTKRIFDVNFKQLIPGSVYEKLPPPGWYGHEVVLFRNIPQQVLQQQLAAPWLKSVPVVVYSVDSRPLTSFVTHAAPAATPPGSPAGLSGDSGEEDAHPVFQEQQAHSDALWDAPQQDSSTPTQSEEESFEFPSASESPYDFGDGTSTDTSTPYVDPDGSVDLF